MEIQDYINERIAGVSFASVNNGDLLIKVEDPGDVPGVVATIAEYMQDWDSWDLQITTNSAKGEVYVREFEDEDYEDED